MMRFKISNEEIQQLLSGRKYQYPKYATQIMNLANKNSQGTRARVVGQMSDLIQEFKGQTLDEWETWYLDKHPTTIEDATERVWGMVRNFQEVIGHITKEMVHRWVEELVLVKTFCGLKFQEAVLKKIARIKKTTYRLAFPEEEARGIDGLIGDQPVSVKPESYKAEILDEQIRVPIIFYSKERDGINVSYDL